MGLGEWLCLWTKFAGIGIEVGIDTADELLINRLFDLPCSVDDANGSIQ